MIGGVAPVHRSAVAELRPPLLGERARSLLRVIRETEGLPENEAFALEARVGMEVFASEDAREGPRAFAEKRRPEFRDR